MTVPAGIRGIWSPPSGSAPRPPARRPDRWRPGRSATPTAARSPARRKTAPSRCWRWPTRAAPTSTCGSSWMAAAGCPTATSPPGTAPRTTTASPPGPLSALTSQQWAERPLHLGFQVVGAPGTGVDEPDDRLGVVVERDLVAAGVDDPPVDPAGPLRGQVGHDRGHVAGGPLVVALGPGPAPVGRHRVGHPGGRTGRNRVHGHAVLG